MARRGRYALNPTTPPSGRNMNVSAISRGTPFNPLVRMGGGQGEGNEDNIDNDTSNSEELVVYGFR